MNRVVMTIVAACLCVLLMICGTALAEEAPATEMTDAELEAFLQELSRTIRHMHLPCGVLLQHMFANGCSAGKLQLVLR